MKLETEKGRIQWSRGLGDWETGRHGEIKQREGKLTIDNWPLTILIVKPTKWSIVKHFLFTVAKRK